MSCAIFHWLWDICISKIRLLHPGVQMRSVRFAAFQGFREWFWSFCPPVFFLRRDESVHVCLFLIWSRHQDKFTVLDLVDLVFSRGALAHHDIQRDKMEFKCYTWINRCIFWVYIPPLQKKTSKKIKSPGRQKISLKRIFASKNKLPWKRTYFGGGKLWGAARKSDHHHATSILRTGDLFIKPSRMPRGCKIPQFPQICIEFDRNVQDLLKISIILFKSLSTYSCTWEQWSLHT